jgi:nitric oxide reductase large subunit
MRILPTSVMKCATICVRMKYGASIYVTEVLHDTLYGILAPIVIPYAISVKTIHTALIC